MINKNVIRIPPELDALDEEIVKLLIEDGRMPNTEIAERLHIAEATARRRINRLKEEKIIKVVAVRNPDHFKKFLSTIINIKCERSEIIKTEGFLTNRAETRYVGYSTGKWNLVAEAFFIDNDHLLDFLLEVGELEGVTDIETSVMLRIAKFSYEWEFDTLFK
ncbi:Lrp/AsnC family transcriptional regulator [Sporosarcina sp. FSL W7-1349]|uniref:Lrp/AsnC family transcriptional regulator n=1 Tax=Sporosarcina sp. FSL W7-1349 TaxID=2921561 RepID=UPI0030FA9583